MDSRSLVAARCVMLMADRYGQLSCHHCPGCRTLHKLLYEITDILLQEASRTVTVREAAKLCGKSTSQIRRWIRTGKIRTVGGNGERRRVYVADLPLVGTDWEDTVRELRRHIESTYPMI